jgi:hypothetical protein
MVLVLLAMGMLLEMTVQCDCTCLLVRFQTILDLAPSWVPREPKAHTAHNTYRISSCDSHIVDCCCCCGNDVADVENVVVVVVVVDCCDVCVVELQLLLVPFPDGCRVVPPVLLAINVAAPNRHALGVKAPLCDVGST